ncbi:MAG: ester cyclase [Pseudomonas sp.]
MNLEWSQYWIGLFAGNTDELMTLYAEKFEFEDVNLEVHIKNDLAALRRFFSGFNNDDKAKSQDVFKVFDYVGDNRLGSFQWTWETVHAGDFLGVAAAGKTTKTRGVTVMGWDENGKIILERSIWDAIPVLRQLGAIT